MHFISFNNAFIKCEQIKFCGFWILLRVLADQGALGGMAGVAASIAKAGINKKCKKSCIRRTNDTKLWTERD